MASLLRCPTYSCHHRPSSFPTRGGLHCQGLQLDTKAKILSEKPTTFATNSTTFTQKSTGFSHFFWPMGAQRPTIGESSPRGRECATNKAAHSKVSPTAVGVFLLIAPLSVAKEGRCFCPSPAAGGQMAVGAKGRVRAGESVDVAVRKHGGKAWAQGQKKAPTDVS